MRCASAAPEKTLQTCLQAGFGFTWCRPEPGRTLLRAEEARYTLISEPLLGLLQQLAPGGSAATLPADARSSLERLVAGGFLRPGAAVRERALPADIRLWPRLAACAVVLIGLLAVLALRWDNAWPPAASWWVNLWVLPGFAVAAVLHELGHYFAARPYFQPRIRFGMLNRVVPAILTLTNDAWSCPRGVRIWINLAGPAVDLALAALLALVSLVFFPTVDLLFSLLLIQVLRVLFVLNPLLEGDGYWCLCDVLGVVNLCSRGWSDLRRLRPSRYAAYALCSAVFLLCSLGLALRIVWGLLGAG